MSSSTWARLRIAAAFAALSVMGCAQGAEEAVVIPAPAVDEPASDAATAVAVFAGGCFWGVQGVYQHVEGVLKAVSGYAGGAKATAYYEAVGEGDTGHAETVQVTYDPSKVTYGRLLQIYFSVAHDPTQLNRQGPDHGTQYRSIILYHDEHQKQVAEASKKAATGQFRDPIVTEIVPLTKFYKAEGYHQNYYNNNSNKAYCQFVIRPKLDKLLKKLSKPKP